MDGIINLDQWFTALDAEIAKMIKVLTKRLLDGKLSNIRMCKWYPGLTAGW